MLIIQCMIKGRAGRGSPLRTRTQNKVRTGLTTIEPFRIA